MTLLLEGQSLKASPALVRAGKQRRNAITALEQGGNHNFRARHGDK